MESSQAQKNRAAAFAQEQIEAALKVIKTAQSPAEFFILKDCLENAGKYADQAFNLAIAQTLEAKQKLPPGARNTIKETPDESVTNELPPF